MKFKHVYGGAIIFSVFYVFLIIVDISFVQTRFLYNAFDLNEWFFTPWLSYFIWTVLWAGLGAISGYGFYKKNKWMAFLPIVFFIIVNIFSQLIIMALFYFACRNGCYFW